MRTGAKELTTSTAERAGTLGKPRYPCTAGNLRSCLDLLDDVRYLTPNDGLNRKTGSA
jgi:hypothetical protein